MPKKQGLAATAGKVSLLLLFADCFKLSQHLHLTRTARLARTNAFESWLQLFIDMLACCDELANITCLCLLSIRYSEHAQ